MRKLINRKCEKVLKSIDGSINPVKIFNDMVNATELLKKVDFNS